MKRFLSVALASAAILFSPPLAAQNYPNRTVTVVVPFPAGGSVDGTPSSAVSWTAPTSAGGIGEWIHVDQSDLPAGSARYGAQAAVVGTQALLIGGVDANGGDAATTLAAGAQGTTTINYTMPASQPTANQVLAASSVAMTASPICCSASSGRSPESSSTSAAASPVERGPIA